MVFAKELDVLLWISLKLWNSLMDSCQKQLKSVQNILIFEIKNKLINYLGLLRTSSCFYGTFYSMIRD